MRHNSEQVHFRLAPRQQLGIGLRSAIFLIPSVVFLTRPWNAAAGPEPDWMRVGTIVMLISLGALLALTLERTRHCYLVLTPEAAVIRRIRRRTIAWHDVQALCIEPEGGRRVVAVYETCGRRTVLPLPVAGPMMGDSEFVAKFHVIGQWWLAHRGPDWTPVPPQQPWAAPGRPHPV